MTTSTSIIGAAGLAVGAAAFAAGIAADRLTTESHAEPPSISGMDMDKAVAAPIIEAAKAASAQPTIVCSRNVVNMPGRLHCTDGVGADWIVDYTADKAIVAAYGNRELYVIRIANGGAILR